MLWRCRDRELELDERPLLMGILNVTPDSFSDGGKHVDVREAIDYGLRMEADGAAIIDVGGESTRPGAEAVDLDTELSRVLPVIKGLSDKASALISVDTMKAEVASAALDNGAHIINDVSALAHDNAMVSVAAESGAGIVLMHMKGEPRTMQADPRYDDVVSEVAQYLEDRVRYVTEWGVDRNCLVVDPGIGFGKTVEHNLELLANLGCFGAVGLPVLVGLSRKKFLGAVTGRDINERLAGSLSALVYCLLNGANIMRVHDVAESRDALEVALRLNEWKRFKEN